MPRSIVTHSAQVKADTTVSELLAPVDLLLPLRDLRARAAEEAAGEHWLDALLLTCAAGQVVEDLVHRSRSTLDRAAEHLPVGRARLAGPVLGGAATAARALHRARRPTRQLVADRQRVLALSVDLAHAYLSEEAGEPPAPPVARSLARRAAALAAPSRALDGADDRVLRLPACFRSFDQHPADVVELVRSFAADATLDRPILVVGVRTSGSYLGPLAAAAAQRLGARSVDLITVRPGERLDAHQRAAVGALGGGTALVVDDPPVSGEAIARAADELCRAGLAPARVVLLLASDAPDGSLPTALDRFPRHVLVPTQWHLPRRLTPDAVQAEVARLLPLHQKLADVSVLDPGALDRDGRDHRRVWLAATLHDEDSGHDRAALVVAQAVGIGFFGRHAVAVAERLGSAAATVLGFDDGVLFQVVTGDEGDVRPGPPRPEAAGAYAAARGQALPVPLDRAATLRGRQAVWEVAAELVGRSTGRLDPLLRLTMVSPVVRALLRTDSPSIIDGRTWHRTWLRTSEGGRKLDVAEGAFSNHDLACNDAAYDVAASSSPGVDGGALARARATYEAATGQRVEAARWALLRLVHAWDQRRAGRLDAVSWGPEVSRVLAELVGEVALDVSVAPGASGGWVALDVDGVLETGVLGGSTPGTAGATALRALIAHGHRVVPCTGRGAAEVAARVAAWGLPGAVAEYGSTIVLAGQDEPVDLRDDAGRAAIERLRAHLAADPGVVVDPGHRFGVRAWS
ncbi:MAG: hypothetical protein JWN46_1682, partial [Acidimicrobiales bacterium]|nr:hypothetical protein [Acidimicrobiales bacterium]